MGHMPGGDSENDTVLFCQRSQQISRAVKRHFRVDVIGTQQRKPPLIGRDHFLDRRIRAGQSRKNELQRYSNQRQAFVLGRPSEPEFIEDNAVRFDDQFPAIDESPVEVEDHELDRMISIRG
jgi:hypothetical protein